MLWPLSDDAGFLEAEISLPVIHGLPNDHMIQELDLKHSGRFANPAGQPHISFARVGVPRYAACGISGVMPYPVLCRTEHEVPSAEALSDAA